MIDVLAEFPNPTYANPLFRHRPGGRKAGVLS
jgi:hypothetical protein